MEEIPLLFPKSPKSFSILFRALEILHGDPDSANPDTLNYLEKISDALVYELHLLDSDSLADAVEERLTNFGDKLKPQELYQTIQDDTVSNLSDEVLSSRLIRNVEESYRMN
jgi:hypothetical protein